MKRALEDFPMRRAAPLFLAACLLPGAAPAAILCVDQFQYSAGRWIATPLCQDGYLAQIAREHGARVSDWSIIENPQKKIRICNFIGFDRRAELACAGYRNGNGSGR
jgi:hypothetical protein